MVRLFTGLEIPSDVGQSLSMLRGGLPGARWRQAQSRLARGLGKHPQLHNWYASCRHSI